MRRDVIILIVIIVIAIVIIVWFVPRSREGFKNLGSKYMASKTMKKEVETKKPLCGCGKAQGSCSGCAAKNKVPREVIYDEGGIGTKDSSLDNHLADAERNKIINKNIPANNTQLYAPTLFDLFTPQEDTIALYGVTKDELDLLVEEYREEHTYTVPQAPKSLTFNIRDTERANDILEDSMYNLAVHRRPYEQDGSFAYMQMVQ
jgi:hypothetical protein